MQKAATNEYNNDNRKYSSRSMEEKYKRQDKLITIVQSVNGQFNDRGYEKKSNMVTIPKVLCKLVNVAPGDLISWALTDEPDSLLVKVIYLSRNGAAS